MAWDRSQTRGARGRDSLSERILDARRFLGRAPLPQPLPPSNRGNVGGARGIDCAIAWGERGVVRVARGIKSQDCESLSRSIQSSSELSQSILAPQVQSNPPVFDEFNFHDQTNCAW